MIPRALIFCEVEHVVDGGLHLCGRNAGHDGDHVCAMSGICGVRWGRVEVVVADHLGPCARCGDVVRPLEECSTCLEEAGSVRHAEDCCDE